MAISKGNNKRFIQNSKNNSRGFSLLEVLVALVLSAMVITALMSLVKQQRDSQNAVIERSEILFQASMLMNQWLSTPIVTPASLSEDVGDGRKWSVQIKQIMSGSKEKHLALMERSAQLLKIEVCCKWSNNGKGKRLCLQSERTAPPPLTKR